MFRIRRIYDDIRAVDKQAIRQVQELIRLRFPLARPDDIDHLPEKLRSAAGEQFRTMLYVADRSRGRVVGLAVVLHHPELRFCYLDYIASARGLNGRGIGGALYDHVREEALALNARAMLFECLPDDPGQCSDPDVLRHNIARMRFYELFGARPIIGTAYQTPVREGDECLPQLMFDGLGLEDPLSRDYARSAVRAILEGKYAYLCPPEYNERVIESFVDDPVQIRPPRYKRPQPLIRPTAKLREPFPLIVNDRHNIHHIRERGYVESPVRIRSILAELDPTGLFMQIEPKEFGEEHITAVHAPDFVEHLRKICAQVPPGKAVYPYVFPIRNATRPPKEISVLAGYYCIDTFTPLNFNAFPAAKRAVDCSLTAADMVLAGRRMAYALVRPPGHHAERCVFGGFCYFNNAAIAAHYLSQHGTVAILDVDYHHGNGQQDIFYHRDDVLTVSLHGDPSFAYPYFSGFEDERGVGPGEGFNMNFPLAEVMDGALYRLELRKALDAVADFKPTFLIVALGLDPAKGDPTGTWLLTAGDFAMNGRMIAELRLPTLVVQEGGYRTRTLGVNARRFFEGFMAGAQTTGRLSL